MASAPLTVCTAPALAPGERRAITVDGLQVMALNCGGEVFAVGVTDDLITSRSTDATRGRP